MARDSSSYYARRSQSEEATGQRSYNLQQRYREKTGGQSEWDVLIPKDVENVNSEVTVAPTTYPKRPRALTIGYNPNSNTLVVVFRDNTWWQYNNVPVDMWLSLKSSESTGRYLRESGLDRWSDMGPADLDALSEGVKAQISSSAQTASGIQNSGSALEGIMQGEGNIRDYTAEELFKDYL